TAIGSPAQARAAARSRSVSLISLAISFPACRSPKSRPGTRFRIRPAGFLLRCGAKAGRADPPIPDPPAFLGRLAVRLCRGGAAAGRGAEHFLLRQGGAYGRLPDPLGARPPCLSGDVGGACLGAAGGV